MRFARRMCSRLADSDNNQPLKLEGVGDIPLHPFLWRVILRMMRKDKILSRIFSMAQDYSLYFENKNMLFVYKDSNGLQYIESLFLGYHFRHLIGIKTELCSNDFYKRALTKRLSEKDLGKVESVVELKFDAFPLLKDALVKGCSISIGRKNQGIGYRIYSDLLVGTTKACLGFVEDSGSDFYVPNTLLKADIRKEAQKSFLVLLVCIKDKKESLYSVSFCREGFDRSCLPDEILSRVEAS